MTITIKGPYFDGYHVEVDDEIIMECLSEKEVNNLTIGEIRSLLAMDL